MKGQLAVPFFEVEKNQNGISGIVATSTARDGKHEARHIGNGISLISNQTSSLEGQPKVQGTATATTK